MADEEGAGEGAGGTEDTGWIESLDESARGFIETKGWKAPSDVIQSYRSLEQMQGAPAERLVRLPEKGPDEDPDGWSQVYQKLGRPAEVGGYELPAPDGMPEGTLDLTKDFADWALEDGLTKTQARSLVGKYNARLQAVLEEMATKQSEEVALADQALRKKWGGEYENHIAAGKRFARVFGLSEDWLTKLEGVVGYQALLEGAARIGLKLAEDAFPPGEGDTPPIGSGMSPEAAKVKIAELKADRQWQEDSLSDDPAKAKNARDRMRRLSLIAFPD